MIEKQTSKQWIPMTKVRKDPMITFLLTLTSIKSQDYNLASRKEFWMICLRVRHCCFPSVNQSFSRSINRSISLLVGQSVNLSVNQSIDRSTNHFSVFYTLVYQASHQRDAGNAWKDMSIYVFHLILNSHVWWIDVFSHFYARYFLGAQTLSLFTLLWKCSSTKWVDMKNMCYSHHHFFMSTHLVVIWVLMSSRWLIGRILRRDGRVTEINHGTWRTFFLVNSVWNLSRLLCLTS